MKEFLQKAVIGVVTSFLEVIVQFNDFFLFLFDTLKATFSIAASLHPWEVRTPLCSNSMMLDFNIAEEESPYPLVDCKRHHLRYRGEALMGR